MMSAGLQGCLLALTTALFWGTLPIALKQVSTTVAPLTIVWLRFTVAAVWLWLWLPHPRRRLLAHDWSEGRVPALVAAAALCLGGNFVLYNTSVVYVSAPAAQLIAQAGPLLLMVGGVALLRERMTPRQALGGAALVGGLLLFFNDRLHELASLASDYGLGIALGLLGAFTWAAYGVMQKALLRECSAAETLRAIYTFVAVGLTPFAHPKDILALDMPQLLCLAYCCLNTIVAYGCFGRAMGLWHTAGVGAILSLTPLFTLACTELANWLVPSFFPPVTLNALSYTGALVVVAGATLMALGSRQPGP